MVKAFSLFFFLFGGFTVDADHDLFMSICEVERVSDDQLEVRFYLFHDDLKLALYNQPNATDISPEDAQKYLSEKTKLTLNGQEVLLEFKSLDYREDQARLIYRKEILPNQKIEKIELTNHLLLEHFPTQVNMVYFIDSDGERLVKMLDATQKVALFSF